MGLSIFKHTIRQFLIRRNYGKKLNTKIHHLASILPSAQIGRDCHIGEYAAIRENVKIGDLVKIRKYADIQNISISHASVIEMGVIINWLCKVY